MKKQISDVKSLVATTESESLRRARESLVGCSKSSELIHRLKAVADENERLLVAYATALSEQTNLRNERDRAQAELDPLRKTISVKGDEIEKLKKDLKKASDDAIALTSKANEADRLNHDLDIARRTIQSLQNDIDGLKKQLNDNQAETNALKNNIKAVTLEHDRIVKLSNEKNAENESLKNQLNRGDRSPVDTDRLRTTLIAAQNENAKLRSNVTDNESLRNRVASLTAENERLSRLYPDNKWKSNPTPIYDSPRASITYPSSPKKTTQPTWGTNYPSNDLRLSTASITKTPSQSVQPVFRFDGNSRTDVPKTYYL